MTKIVDLLNELEEMVDKGNAIPFSSKAMIDPAEFLEVLDELRGALPKEIEEARQIVAQEKKILFEAEQEAQKLKTDMEAKMRLLVNQDQFVVETKNRGEALLTAAKQQSQKLMENSYHYADKMLYDLQVHLKQLNDTIEANRKELANGMGQ